jgi:hypothetical protein
MRRRKLTGLQYGIGVPKGGVATNAAEAEKIAKEIGTWCAGRCGREGRNRHRTGLICAQVVRMP